MNLVLFTVPNKLTATLPVDVLQTANFNSISMGQAIKLRRWAFLTLTSHETIIANIIYFEWKGSASLYKFRFRNSKSE